MSGIACSVIGKNLREQKELAHKQKLTELKQVDPDIKHIQPEENEIIN
jgi:hypothetical protein